MFDWLSGGATMIQPAEIKHLFTKTRGEDHKYRAVCPLHGKKDLNLSVYIRNDGTIGFNCYSQGCDRKEILAALGFSLADALPDRTSAETRKHKRLANQTRLKKDLEHELLILLCWIADSYQNVFPRCSTDQKKLKAALAKSRKLIGYFLREGAR
jgi:hypothetical protein